MWKITTISLTFSINKFEISDIHKDIIIKTHIFSFPFLLNQTKERNIIIFSSWGVCDQWDVFMCPEIIGNYDFIWQKQTKNNPQFHDLHI